MAGISVAAVLGRIAVGPRAGGRVRRLGQDQSRGVAVARGPRQAQLGGSDLHANAWVAGRDRARLERLCRYLLRPPLAQERLRRRADGRVLVEGPDWPPARLRRVARNYAMDYVRTILPLLAETFGEAEARHRGGVTGRLIGMQCDAETAEVLGIAPGGAEGFARYLAALGQAQDDGVEWEREGDEVVARQRSWRLMAGLPDLPVRCSTAGMPSGRAAARSTTAASPSSSPGASITGTPASSGGCGGGRDASEHDAGPLA